MRKIELEGKDNGCSEKNWVSRENFQSFPMRKD